MHGTYRRDRHGPWPPTVSVMPVQPPELPGWEPAPEDLAALKGPGKRFLTLIIEESQVSVVQGTLLVEMAYTLDALTAWRAQAATDVKAAKLTLAHAHTFCNLLAAQRAW
jgi:hypothetical protein